PRRGGTLRRNAAVDGTVDAGAATRAATHAPADGRRQLGRRGDRALGVACCRGAVLRALLRPCDSRPLPERHVALTIATDRVRTSEGACLSPLRRWVREPEDSAEVHIRGSPPEAAISRRGTAAALISIHLLATACTSDGPVRPPARLIA